MESLGSPDGSDPLFWLQDIAAMEGIIKVIHINLSCIAEVLQENKIRPEKVLEEAEFFLACTGPVEKGQSGRPGLAEPPTGQAMTL